MDRDTPRIIQVDETESTNSFLKELVRKEHVPEGSAVVAKFQTKGRGQADSSWESAYDKNLLFSIVIYPDGIWASRQFLISQIAALSVKETLECYTDQVSIKWPNDIYRKDQKISGMLIENDLSGQTICCSVIGIGINVNQSFFTGNLPNPVSLYQITGKEWSRDEIFHRFLRKFFDYYLLLLQEKETWIRERYLAALYRKDGFYPYSDANGRFQAQIQAIDLTGHLVLQLENGERRRYAFKEVSYVI